MAKASSTVKIDLELSAEEAQLLVDIYGWGIGGAGPHRDLFKELEAALRKVGFKPSSANPKHISGTIYLNG